MATNSSSEPGLLVVSAIDGRHGPDRLDGQNAEDMAQSGNTGILRLEA